MQTHDKPRHLPIEIAPETFVIQDTTGEGVAPQVVHLNSMVIRGREPVIVDTGHPANRDRFLEDLTGLVDPADVRWIFISHDDIDHDGNLDALLELCPDAMLVTTWFAMQRRWLGQPPVPLDRVRWVRAGEWFHAGDRTLYAIAPPLYDSPTTRGLYDPTTGVYWASDCFAAAVPHAAADSGDVERQAYADGFMLFNRWNSPWHQIVEECAYQRQIDFLANLDITAVASCHGPAITGDNVREAISLLRQVPALRQPEEPGQDVLDAIVQALRTEVPPAA